MKPEDMQTMPDAESQRPSVEVEIAAVKTVIDALIALPTKEAQHRVISHAVQYVGLQQRMW